MSTLSYDIIPVGDLTWVLGIVRQCHNVPIFVAMRSSEESFDVANIIDATCTLLSA
jgi:hypothetical protein